MALKLKELMQKRGLTQVQTADLLEISPGYLSLLVSGQRDPSPKLLTHMARSFQVSVGDLFDDARMTNGFAEAPVEPLHGPKNDPRSIAAVLGVTARHPTLYGVNFDHPSLSIHAGDRLLVDLNFESQPGDIVLATVIDDNAGGMASTGIYRWLDPWLVDGLTQAPEKNDDSGQTAILGRVSGVIRKL